MAKSLRCLGVYALRSHNYAKLRRLERPLATSGRGSARWEGAEGGLVPDLLGVFSHEEGIIHIFMDVIAKACSSIRVSMEALGLLRLLEGPIKALKR